MKRPHIPSRKGNYPVCLGCLIKHDIMKAEMTPTRTEFCCYICSARGVRRYWAKLPAVYEIAGSDLELIDV